MARIRRGNIPSDHPAVPELKAFGFKAHMEFDVPRELVRKDNPLQVREDPEDKTRAKHYATAMRAGAKFYAPVVTADYAAVDGNGRLDAYEELKLTTIPELVVIEIESDAATEEEMESLIIIGGTLNENGPKRLSHVERRRMIMTGIKRGLSADQLARRFTAKSSEVSDIRAEVRAAERLQEVGLGDLKLPVTIVRILGGEKAGKLLKRPFRDFVELVSDSGSKAPEVRGQLSELTEMDSESEQMDHLLELRSLSSERIRQFKLTGDHPSPAPSSTARRVLGNIYPKYANSPRTLTRDIPADARKDYILAYQGAARVLQAAAQILLEEDGNHWG